MFENAMGSGRPLAITVMKIGVMVLWYDTGFLCFFLFFLRLAVTDLRPVCPCGQFFNVGSMTLNAMVFGLDVPQQVGLGAWGGRMGMQQTFEVVQVQIQRVLVVALRAHGSAPKPRAAGRDSRVLGRPATIPETDSGRAPAFDCVALPVIGTRVQPAKQRQPSHARGRVPISALPPLRRVVDVGQVGVTQSPFALLVFLCSVIVVPLHV